MIKKSLLYFTACMMIAFLAVSCEPAEEVSFDSTLLTGKWQSGTLFYKYLANGTGTTWDTADDVTEAEAQAFTWTLIKAELTHIHIMEIGGNVPKVYTVTELTSSTLKYKDDFGGTFSFTKVAR